MTWLKISEYPNRKSDLYKHFNVSGVYMIKSMRHPDKFYIGSTLNVCSRVYQHYSELRIGKHPSTAFQKYYEEFGGDDLYVTVMYEGKKKRDWFEKEYIKQFQPYFNTNNKKKR